MTELEDWTKRRPVLPSRPSEPSSIQSSVARKPLGAAAAPHRRNTSDDVSICSEVQLDDTASFSRQISSVSAQSRSWLPIQRFAPSSPPMDGSEGEDLGSSQMNQSFGAHTLAEPEDSPLPSQGQPAVQHSPPVPFSSRRPKPSPFQFEDNPEYSTPNSFRSTFSSQSRFLYNRTDSQARLIGSQPASEWTTAPPPAPPTYASVLPNRKKWWKWRRAWIMYIFLLFGFCCALGHHLFYAALDGRPADNQLAMLRYGTILAFAAKAGFVAAVVTAYRQRIWATVSNKLLSVAALDSLFAATEDLFALWNAEIYQRAKLAMLLAAIVWLTPLVIILTSNTLLVAQVENVMDTECPGVRTLNLTGEELEEFRNPTKIDGLYGLAISLWNTTSTNVSSPDWYDYYTGPTDAFQATANLGIYSHQVMGSKSASLEVCGSGWNCTYTINFVAPGYKCTEVASGVGSTVQNLGSSKPPFGTDILLPAGDYSYYAYTSGGDYSIMQMKEVWPGGIPTSNPPYPKNLGAFRTEPIIWVGYVVRANPNETPPNNSSQPGWNESFIPKVFACEHYETAYTVDFRFEGKDQTTNVTKREYLRPVMNTTYLRGVDAMDGTNDNTTATPESGYVFPYPYSDVQRYRRVATFHSFGSVLRNSINGTVNSASIQVPYANTNALQTKLLNPRQEFFAYPNLQDLVTEMYEDIVLSMLSNNQLLVVAWAAKPHEISGDLLGNDSTLYPCTRTRWENRYKYVARDLWIVYVCALLCALVAVILGTVAVLENEGKLYDTRFSSIVAATRGPALEKVVWKEDEGHLLPDIKNLKVGYGLVHRASTAGEFRRDTRYQERVLWDGGEVRYGFGLEGDVSQLKSEGSLFRGRS